MATTAQKEFFYPSDLIPLYILCEVILSIHIPSIFQIAPECKKPTWTEPSKYSIIKGMNAHFLNENEKQIHQGHGDVDTTDFVPFIRLENVNIADFGGAAHAQCALSRCLHNNTFSSMLVIFGNSVVAYLPNRTVQLTGGFQEFRTFRGFPENNSE